MQIMFRQIQTSLWHSNGTFVRAEHARNAPLKNLRINRFQFDIFVRSSIAALSPQPPRIQGGHRAPRPSLSQRCLSINQSKSRSKEKYIPDISIIIYIDPSIYLHWSVICTVLSVRVHTNAISCWYYAAVCDGGCRWWLVLTALSTQQGHSALSTISTISTISTP